MIMLSSAEQSLFNDIQDLYSGEMLDIDIPAGEETASVPVLTPRQAALLRTIRREGLYCLHRLSVDEGDPIEALVVVLVPSGRPAIKRYRF